MSSASHNEQALRVLATIRAIYDNDFNAFEALQPAEGDNEELADFIMAALSLAATLIRDDADERGASFEEAIDDLTARLIMVDRRSA